MVCKPVRIRLNSKAYKLALCGCTDKGSSASAKRITETLTKISNLQLCGVKNGCFGANKGQKDYKCTHVVSIVGGNVTEANAIPLTFHSTVVVGFFPQPSGPPTAAAPTPAEAWRPIAGAAAVGAWRSCLSLDRREQPSRR